MDNNGMKYLYLPSDVLQQCNYSRIVAVVYCFT